MTRRYLNAPPAGLNRREAIARALILTFATALPASAEAAIRTFDSATVIAAVAEATIPGDDTPGALQADVDGFIRNVIENYLPETAAAQWHYGLQTIAAELAGHPAQHHSAILSNLESRLARNKPTGKVLMLLKQLTITGYCTTEIGAKALFLYDPVPGNYESADVDDDFRTTYLSFGFSPADLLDGLTR